MNYNEPYGKTACVRKFKTERKIGDFKKMQIESSIPGLHRKQPQGKQWDICTQQQIT